MQSTVERLQAAGVPATWIDARQVVVTTGDHAAAQPLFDDTAASLERHVRPVLDAGRVPVLGGYVGATRDGITTTLGRGGSDFSAAIVGAGLGADEIQIWTDVDGMLTADPRLVGGGRVVPALSFDEARNADRESSEVPRTRRTAWPEYCDVTTIERWITDVRLLIERFSRGYDPGEVPVDTAIRRA